MKTCSFCFSHSLGRSCGRGSKTRLCQICLHVIELDKLHTGLGADPFCPYFLSHRCTPSHLYEHCRVMTPMAIELHTCKGDIRHTHHTLVHSHMVEAAKKRHLYPRQNT